MDGSSLSGNNGSSSRPLLALLKSTVCLRVYAERLDVQRFRTILARQDSRIVYDERHGVRRETQVGAWINRWTHRGGRGAAFRQDDAPSPKMLFLCCTEQRGYIERAPEIVSQYVDIS